MTPVFFRRSLSFLFILCFFVALSAQAGKRRAVGHPSPAGEKLTLGTVSGVVLDDSTGLPINAVRVAIGTKEDVTAADGKFSAKNVTGYGAITVAATRSGYVTKSASITTSGDHQITLRMTPTPTVRVRKTDGTTLNVDFESLEFGYAVPFSGYRKYPYDEFCKNGVSVQIDRAEMKQINGPATIVASGVPCCPGTNVLKVGLELKNGEKFDGFFVDSCEAGVTRIDLIARDHTQGQFVYLPFSELSEVVFP